jgi:hypothetical protein
MKRNAKPVEQFVSIEEWERRYLPNSGVLESVDFDGDKSVEEWEQAILERVAHSPAAILPPDKRRLKP